MRKKMARLMLALGAFFGLMLGAAHAQTVERIDVTEFGIYTADTTRIVSAPQSTTGIAQHVSASSIKLAKATTTVPGRIGVRFGFRYRIVGEGQSVTLRRIVHIPEPGVHNPEKGIILTS